MSDAEIVISVKADDSGGKVVKRTLDDVAASSSRATNASQALEKVLKSLDGIAALLQKQLKQSASATNDLQSTILKASSSAFQLQKSLDGISTAANKLNSSLSPVKAALDNIGKNSASTFDRMRAGINGAVESMGIFRQALALLGFRELVRMSDNFTLLRERMKQATTSSSEFEQAFKGLQSVSAQTGASLNDAVDVFQRLSFVRTELKTTIADMLTFTGTVQKLGVLSGASTTAMSAGLLQLGQAMSAGVVRAEEFNSVVENLPAVAKAVADQFGVTTGQLRLLVLEGVVASEDFYNAILNNAQSVEAAYASMPMTIGRAFNALYNDMQAFIGVSSQTSGASMAVIGVIDLFRIAISGLGTAFEIVVATIAKNVALIVKTVQEAINGLITGINFAIDLANKVPGFPKKTDLITKVDFTGGASYSDILAAYDAQTNEILSKSGPNTIFDKAIQGTDTPTASAQRTFTKDYDALAAKLSENTKLTKEQKKIQDQLTDAVRDTRTEQEKWNLKIKEYEALKPYAKTTEQLDAISRGIKQANDELDKLTIKAELDGPMGKAFSSLANEIDDGLKDAFKDSFKESEGGFKKLMSGMVGTFKDAIAEMAYQALAKPIVVSVIAGLGSSLGLTDGAIASVLKDSGTGLSSGMSSGNIGSIGSTLGNLLNGGLYSNFLGGIGSGVGNVLSGQAWGAMGPSKAAAIGGGAFGNLGYGALGSIGANLFGLGNKNPVVNFASGTLGSLAGGAIGTSLGTILGMAGGPIGAIAGGFLGTTIGGLFGGGMPRTTLSAILGLDEGRYSVSSYNTKGADKSKALDFGTQVITALNSFADALGGDFTQAFGKIETNIGKKDVKTLVGNTKVSSQGGDINAAVRYILNMQGNLTGADSRLMSVLNNSMGKNSDLNQVLSDVQFAQSIYELIDPKNVDPVGDALKVINEQFDAMVIRATDLGIPLDQVNQALDKQRQQAIDLVKAQQAGFASMEQMTATFKSFFDSQSLSDNSTLSPLAKLQLAQGNFGDLLGKAQGGDLSVTSDLLKSASDLLAIGRSVYASSTSFAGLETFVRTSVSEIAKAAGVPGYAVGTGYAPGGLAWVGEKGPELVNFRGGESVYTAQQSSRIAEGGKDTARTNAILMAQNAELVEKNEAMLSELIKMRKSFERFGNKATA